MRLSKATYSAVNVFLKYTLDTIIGTPRNSYE